MKQVAKFSRSKVENLFKHRAGNYYAVVKVDGKIRRQSLETDDYNLAKERLPATLESLRGATAAKTAGTLRSAILEEANRNDATLKDTTKHYHQQVAKSLLLTSDTLPARPAEKALPRVILADLRPWMDKYAAKASRTRFNGGLALLRRTYQRAIEARQLRIEVGIGDGVGLEAIDRLLVQGHP